VKRVLDSKVRKQPGRVAASKTKKTWVECLVEWEGYPDKI
jgi:hypothetical protein